MPTQDPAAGLHAALDAAAPEHTRVRRALEESMQAKAGQLQQLTTQVGPDGNNHGGEVARALKEAWAAKEQRLTTLRTELKTATAAATDAVDTLGNLNRRHTDRASAAYRAAVKAKEDAELAVSTIQGRINSEQNLL